MEYTTLGRTGASVSRLGFGGAPAGLTNYLGDYTPEDLHQRGQVIDAIHTAVEMGVTYFDTAPGSGQGASEEIFGAALAGIRRPLSNLSSPTPWSMLPWSACARHKWSLKTCVFATTAQDASI